MASASSSGTQAPDAAAKAAFRCGDFAAAEKMYGDLLLSKPRPEASVLSGFAVNRANCLLRLSRTTDAELSCRIALRLQPNSIAAHEMLAAVLHRMVNDGQRWRIHEEVRRERGEVVHVFVGAESSAEMFVDTLFRSFIQVAERQWIWEAHRAAKDKNQEQLDKVKQALEKARARMAEIGLQRVVDAKQGQQLLGQQKFEEVSDVQAFVFLAFAHVCHLFRQLRCCSVH
jgi:tetratricopeptide (TPR) repeat protein